MGGDTDELIRNINRTLSTIKKDVEFIKKEVQHNRALLIKIISNMPLTEAPANAEPDPDSKNAD